ncbi:NAD(P)H-binding protein [Nocardia yamanashiensis]|uniref:PEP-utilizing enzyme n=1 Tax=Nocardia yamanashiensis TaxID=209247 RepID=UPI001E60EBB4|nr:PEP-utilizing enzyme [Nocardia yamanashiensis]UGT41749.1 NAD(P)H-binding protein [Nocardia yamanashiensis]
MRILVTGVTEPSGKAVARMLLAAGHEVTGLDRQRDRYVDPRVEQTVGDPADARTCARAVTGVDAVVHLAGNAVAGIAQAAAEAGVRLVVPVAAGQDSVERAVTASGADALIVRTALVAGRRIDGAGWRPLESLTAGKDGFQVLHYDDLERFLVQAALSQRSGIVELAAPGEVSGVEVKRILREAGVKYTPWLPKSAANRPRLDTTAAREEWGFRYGWTANEVIVDVARGLHGRKAAGSGFRSRTGAIPLPAHVVPQNAPTSDGYALKSGAPEGLQGEFDDLIDDRIPVFTATNTSEALPGPLTPLTIDLQAGAIRLGNEAMGNMIAIEGIALEHWVSRVTGVLGHHMYINASIGVFSAENMPGWDEESVRRDVYGAIGDVELHPKGRPAMPTGMAKRAGTFKAMGRVARTAMSYAKTAELINAAAHAEAIDRDGIAELTDEQLHARALLWRDRLNQAWQAASIGVMMTGAATAAHKGEVKINLERLESAKTMLAVERLAALCRKDSGLQGVAKSGDVAAAREKSPEFAQALDEELARIGHRGPGECELINATFGDRPELLVTAAGRAAEMPAPHREPVPDPTSRTAKMAVGATVYRERARDAVVRVTNCLRLATQERAARLIKAGKLTEIEDSAFLTLDEILWAPADLKERVARRRAERTRYQGVRMPDVVNGEWEPEEVSGALPVGGTLSGLGVSPGVVEGTVKRVLSLDDDIEPGDILVASVTDTGHTAMFGYAGAVVTDIGGAASHAAIVAREFGVPCVVDTKTASTSLSDGQRVRVDGAAGTITLLADPE